MSISFNDQVAIVTGAGGGLGRCHALELAQRGAKVVVNDYGVSMDGSEPTSEPASGPTAAGTSVERWCTSTCRQDR